MESNENTKNLLLGRLNNIFLFITIIQSGLTNNIPLYCTKYLKNDTKYFIFVYLKDFNNMYYKPASLLAHIQANYNSNRK